MAFSNYGELKNELSDYLFNHRFAAKYDSYTKIFEADANSRLRVLPMEAVNIFQTATGSVTLPADYLTWRTVLWIRGGIPPAPPDSGPPYQGVEIDYVHPAYLRNMRSVTARLGQEATLFTIEGNQFRGRTLPSDGNSVDVYEFHYYQKIPTLIGADSNSNWLLAEYPNAYLFGLMVEAAGQGRNAEIAQLYKARRDEVFAEIIQRYALTTGASSPSVRTAEYY